MNNETTQDEIRDFLKGRLSEAAAAAFRQRMANDPALEDRVAFCAHAAGGIGSAGAQKTFAAQLVYRRRHLAGSISRIGDCLVLAARP